MFQTTNQILSHTPIRSSSVGHIPCGNLRKPRAMGFISVSSCAYMGPQGPVVLGKIYGLKLLKTRCFLPLTMGNVGSIYGTSMENH
jgi:hypothetical protein